MGQSAPSLRFNVRFAQQAQDVAGHAHQPETGRQEPQWWGCARAGANLSIPEQAPWWSGEGRREDAKVYKVSDVLEGLVEDVGEALGEGEGPEVRIWAAMPRQGQEATEPGVEWEESGEAERGARVRQEGG